MSQDQISLKGDDLPDEQAFVISPEPEPPQDGQYVSLSADQVDTLLASGKTEEQIESEEEAERLASEALTASEGDLVIPKLPTSNYCSKPQDWTRMMSEGHRLSGRVQRYAPKWLKVGLANNAGAISCMGMLFFFIAVGIPATVVASRVVDDSALVMENVTKDAVSWWSRAFSPVADIRANYAQSVLPARAALNASIASWGTEDAKCMFTTDDAKQAVNGVYEALTKLGKPVGVKVTTNETDQDCKAILVDGKPKKMIVDLPLKTVSAAEFWSGKWGKDDFVFSRGDGFSLIGFWYVANETPLVEIEPPADTGYRSAYSYRTTSTRRDIPQRYVGIYRKQGGEITLYSVSQSEINKQQAPIGLMPNVKKEMSIDLNGLAAIAVPLMADAKE